jgi:nucleoside-diphosphate-sugar epimerase
MICYARTKMSSSISPNVLEKLSIDITKPVLVTGATGYVAGVLIKQLLELGILVHATVRDVTKKEKYQYIQDVADRLNGTIKFFSADLLIDGSFYDAMKDCSIVFHTASPFVQVVEDPLRDLVEPAVKGTKNVLHTALKIPSVTKVIVTSSTAALTGSCADGYNPALMGNAKMVTEDHWNRTSDLISGPYAFSKTLAEQAAWIMAGSQTQWKLVVINPSFVIGPGLISHHESSTSYKVLLSFAGNNNLQLKTGTTVIGMGFVDVRDVATAHIAAAYNPNASGRYLCCKKNSGLDQIPVALLTKYSPKEYPIPTSKAFIPKWLLYLVAPYVDSNISRSFVWTHMNYTTNYDASKIQQDLGITFQDRSFETSLCEMYQQLIDNNVVAPINAGKK